MSEGFEISDSLGDLIDLAFQHAGSSVEKGGPLVPFVLSERGEKRDIQRCIVPGRTKEELDLGASVEQARQLARSRPGRADRVVAVFDGRLGTSADEKEDAFFVEAFETGMSVAALIARRYRPGDHPDGFEFKSDVELLDTTRPMW